MQPAEIVQLQVEAYNKRDIDDFLSFYSDDIKIYKLKPLKSEEPLLYGSIDDMRKRYGSMFKKCSNLHCIIKKRIEQGNFVIDHEHVTGIRPNETVMAVAIYEVFNDKIQSVWFI